jgi:N-acetylglucosaminyldiphosphoundecaprenol N-acetyl-beta-D-mannosaminyltransferase
MLQARTICSIGAVFDFYAGTVKRPSHFWIRLRLEWFIRLIKEPKRMWKRYLYYGPIFIGYILKEKVSALFRKA